MRNLQLEFPFEEWITEIEGLGTSWWDQINESTGWQDGIFYTLCALYAIVSIVALVQLIRIELRVPEYGWTTQKVFHLMNFIVNGVRAIVFGCHTMVFSLYPKVLLLLLLDLPGILFFSTYTLLILFWAEIYYQARSLPADKLKLVYYLINGVIYLIQICLWIYLWIDENSIVEFIGRIFIAAISFIAALGFLVYGGRLFLMLRRFPIESKGRRKKVYEVGSVTIICFICFLVRCLVMEVAKTSLIRVPWTLAWCDSRRLVIYLSVTLFLIAMYQIWIPQLKYGVRVVFVSAFVSEASLDVLDHPILNFFYYMLVEILPSALVLYIMRKLPPRRVSAQYHPIC